MNKYDKFIGRKINVANQVVAGHKYFEIKEIFENNSVVKEVESLAIKDKLSFRVWLPGMFGTMDHNQNRLNIHFEEYEDGFYQISKIDLN